MKNAKPYSSFFVIVAAVLLTTACVVFCAPPGDGDELEQIVAPGAKVDASEPLDPAEDLPSIKAPAKENPAPTSPAEPITEPIKKLQPAAVAAPAPKPAVKPTVKPAPIKPVATQPKAAAPKKAVAPVAVKKTTAPVKKPVEAPQTEEQKLQTIVLRLQMDNSRLMEEINKGQKANASLTDALRESRMHASDLEADIRRKEIELTIKNEKAVLERMKSTASTGPAKSTEILQQENNILALQLKLSRIDEPQRTKEMLETIGNITRERDTLADKNKRIHTMLDEQIKKNEQTAEELKVIRNNFQSSEKEIARLRLEVKAYKEAMANPSAEPRVEYVNKPVATTPAVAGKPSPNNTGASTSPAEKADSEGPSAHKTSKIEINRLAGKITSIDDQIIKINVGSLHGLQAGMRLIVYRRDKFVGYLRVDIVGDTTAAGAMSRQVFAPQIGDNVVDRL